MATYAIAAGAIFLLLMLWVAVDRWTQVPVRSRPDGARPRLDLGSCQSCNLAESCRVPTRDAVADESSERGDAAVSGA